MDLHQKAYHTWDTYKMCSAQKMTCQLQKSRFFKWTQNIRQEGKLENGKWEDTVLKLEESI